MKPTATKARPAAKHQANGRPAPAYLALIDRFPLRPLHSDRDDDAAVAVLDTLGRGNAARASRILETQRTQRRHKAIHPQYFALRSKRILRHKDLRRKIRCALLCNESAHASAGRFGSGALLLEDQIITISFCQLATVTFAHCGQRNVSEPARPVTIKPHSLARSMSC